MNFQSYAGKDYIQAREIDALSLQLLVERSTGGSKLKKDRQIQRIKKAYREGALVIPPIETEQQKWWRAEARFMLGDYSDWSGWEYRDPWAATLWHWRDTKPYGEVKPWNGQSKEHLYIVGEQGIGDEVFFASVIPEAVARSNSVIFECQPRLQKIFERSFGIRTVPSDIRGTQRFKQKLPEEVTAWFPLADLGRYFRHRLSEFPGTPYLKADPEQVKRFESYRGTGISWRGAQGVINEIKTIPGVSLQYDRGWDEDTKIVEGLDIRNDIEGILGLLQNLEKVVSVSTSVAHFAAALGVETHVILADPKTGIRGNLFPFKWACLKTPGRTPWYSCAKVYESWNLYHRTWGLPARA